MDDNREIQFVGQYDRKRYGEYFEVFDLEDGSGAIIFTRGTTLSEGAILSVSRSDRNNVDSSFQFRELQYSGPYRKINIRAIIAGGYAGDLLLTNNAVYLTGEFGTYRVTPKDGMQFIYNNNIPAHAEKIIIPHPTPRPKFIMHPTVPIKFSITYDAHKGGIPVLVIKRQNGTNVKISGAEQLVHARVKSVHAVPNLSTVVIGTDGGWFEVRDRRVTGGLDCNTPILEDPISNEYCIFQTFYLKDKRAYYFKLGSTIEGPDGDVWLATEAGMLSQAPNTQIAKLISNKPDFKFTRYSKETALPWLDAILKLYYTDPNHPSKKFVRVLERSGQVSNVTMADGSPIPKLHRILATLPKRKTVIFWGDKQHIYRLEGKDKLVKFPNSGERVWGMAALENPDIALFFTNDPKLTMKTLHGPVYRQNQLWRLEKDFTRTLLKFPGAPFLGMENPSAPLITRIDPWPSRKAILVTAYHGLFLYQNGRLRAIEGTSERDKTHQRNMNFEQFIDLGPNLPGIGLTYGSPWLIEDDGPAVRLEVSQDPRGVQGVVRDPSSNGLLIATTEGLFRFRPGQKPIPVFERNHPLSGGISLILAPPKWNAVLIKTRKGIRVFGENGKTYRLGGYNEILQHDSRFYLIAGRVFSGSYWGWREIMRRDPAKGGCGP